MCTMSKVMDHYQPLIPNPGDFTWPPTPSPIVPSVPGQTVDVDALRKLIDEFNRAVAAARTIDALTKQPDCEDPEKIKLVERVAELERRIEALEQWRRG